MPRDVMPLWQQAALAREMIKQSHPESLNPSIGGSAQAQQVDPDFSRKVLESMVEGRGRTAPEAITLAGLYGAPTTEHDPGADLGMIDIDQFPGHERGGWYSGDRRQTQIGSALDPATGLHEIAGHGGLSELKRTGELDYALEGPLGRRLGAALPGTFSNQPFATAEEVAESLGPLDPEMAASLKETLGLQPWQPLPPNWVDLWRSEAFEEQMPTAADWMGIQERENWVIDPETGEWINIGMPRRAFERGPYVDPDTGQTVKGTQQGHGVFGQNPFTDQHGGVDALVEAFGPGTGEASPSLSAAQRRLDFYEGRPDHIVSKLTEWRDRMKDGTREPDYIMGGGWFDETWTDEDIKNYATEASIRMAPERALFGGTLSEDIVRSIEEQVGESDAAKRRLEYYKRDLGL